MTYYNRRLFLKSSAAGFLGAAGALSMVSAQSAQAASTGGYKALVGIFLKGGLDGLDVILPSDVRSYDAFASQRRGILSGYNGARSRARSNLTAVQPDNGSDFGGRTFGFSPDASDLASMFSDGDAAIVGNVGPLLEPTDRDGVQTGRSALPAKLFSHNDQQSTWMALGTEGAQQGWGGRIMDRFERSQALPQFARMSATAPDVFLSGGGGQGFRIPDALSGTGLKALANNGRTSNSHGQEARDRLEAFLLDMPDAGRNLYGQDIAFSREKGLRDARRFGELIRDTGAVATPFPDTPVGNRLRNIAVTITQNRAIGNSRQLFYAAQGGFDTHDDQARDLGPNIASVFAAIRAFRDAMVASGQWNDVVVFTMSDFGRTVNENGNGTDHGWGGHQFVFGGGVRGRRIFGEMPTLDEGSERITAARPRLIPKVSVEQYAATLGRWFGLEGGEIDTVLPRLNRFETRDLGFLG